MIGVFSFNFPKAIEMKKKVPEKGDRPVNDERDEPLTPMSPNVGEIVSLEGVPCAHRHVHGDNCSLSRAGWRAAVDVLVLHVQRILHQVSPVFMFIAS